MQTFSPSANFVPMSQGPLGSPQTPETVTEGKLDSKSIWNQPFCPFIQKETKPNSVNLEKILDQSEFPAFGFDEQPKSLPAESTPVETFEPEISASEVKNFIANANPVPMNASTNPFSMIKSSTFVPRTPFNTPAYARPFNFEKKPDGSFMNNTILYPGLPTVAPEF